MTPAHEARLQELEDKAEIAELAHRYADATRLGDVQMMASLFADDAIVDYGPDHVVRGREAIVSHYSVLLKPMREWPIPTNFDERLVTTPIMSNALITVDRDRGRCESMCLAIHAGVREGRELVMIRGTRNVDDVVKTSVGWKISHRIHRTFWSFEVPAVSVPRHEDADIARG